MNVKFFLQFISLHGSIKIQICHAIYKFPNPEMAFFEIIMQHNKNIFSLYLWRLFKIQNLILVFINFTLFTFYDLNLLFSAPNFYLQLNILAFKNSSESQANENLFYKYS